MYFHPDAAIFPKIEFDAAIIKERLEVASYLHQGLKVTFEDETSRDEVVFEHDEGIADYLKTIVAERGAKPVHETPFALVKDEALRLDLVLQWTEGTDEHLRSLRQRHPDRIRRHARERFARRARARPCATSSRRTTSSPKGVTLTAEDIREGLTGVLSIFVQEPQFQGQTKDRLNNPELMSSVDGIVRPALEHWLNQQHQRRRVDRRADHPRRARARGEPRRAGRGDAQERDVGAV